MQLEMSNLKVYPSKSDDPTVSETLSLYLVAETNGQVKGYLPIEIELLKKDPAFEIKGLKF